MPPSYNRSVLAALIEKARINAGLTQEQLGAVVHRGQQAVAKWEAGISKPRVDLMSDLADALGLDPVELLIEAAYLPEPLKYPPRYSDPPGFQQHINGRDFFVPLDRWSDEPTPIEDDEPIEEQYPAALGGKIAQLSNDDRKYVEELVDRLLRQKEG